MVFARFAVGRVLTQVPRCAIFADMARPKTRLLEPDTMRDMMLSGTTAAEIARQAGVSRRQVYDLVNRSMGFAPVPRPKLPETKPRPKRLFYLPEHAEQRGVGCPRCGSDSWIIGTDHVCYRCWHKARASAKAIRSRAGRLEYLRQHYLRKADGKRAS